MANLIGQKFGHLTVIGIKRTEWNKNGFVCRCDCGNEVVRLSFDLRRQRINPATCGKPGCKYRTFNKRPDAKKPGKPKKDSDIMGEWLGKAW